MKKLKSGITDLGLLRQNAGKILKRNIVKENLQFFDFVSSGFFTLTYEGKIIGLNLYGSQMLGKERLNLINSMFGFFVSDNTRTIFNHFLRKIFESRTKENCKVTLSSNGTGTIYVNLNGIIAESGEHCLVTAEDITVRKQSVDTIKELEKQRFAILQNAMDGFWLVDKQGSLLEVNEAYCRMSGFSEKELLSMCINELEAVEVTSEIATRIQKIGILSKDRFETRHRRKDGSIFDVEISVRYKSADDGKFVAFIRDITERRKAEEALKQKEDLLNKAEEIAHLGSWSLDFITNRLTWSDEIYHIFGLEQHEFPATYEGFLDAVHPEDREIINSAYLNSIQEGKESYEIEHRIIRKYSGELRHVYEKCEHIRDASGKIVRSVGMIHDITERKQTADAIMENERLLRESQAMAQIASYSVDLITRTWKASPEMYKIFGIDKTYPNTLDGWFERIHPEFQAALSVYLLRVEDEKKRFDHEYKIFRFKDGNERWVHGLGEIIYDHQLNPVRMIGTLQDITERKYAEEALKRLNEELEDRVKQRTDELLNVTVEVEERERNHFSRELHDGLGPLLSAVKLYFQWLSETDDVEKIRIITEKGNKYIEKAIQTTREVALGLNSVILNNLGYEDTILNFIQSINDTNKLTINFKYNSKDRFNNLLETSLYRITTELINNTVKYAKATYVNITFNYQKEKNRIVFSYHDNGIGFDLDNTTKTNKGLGLMNIQRRIKVIGGTIKIETSFGKGMNVFIELPVNEINNEKRINLFV